MAHDILPESLLVDLIWEVSGIDWDDPHETDGGRAELARLADQLRAPINRVLTAIVESSWEKGVSPDVTDLFKHDVAAALEPIRLMNTLPVEVQRQLMLEFATVLNGPRPPTHPPGWLRGLVDAARRGSYWPRQIPVREASGGVVEEMRAQRRQKLSRSARKFFPRSSKRAVRYVADSRRSRIDRVMTAMAQGAVELAGSDITYRAYMKFLVDVEGGVE
ncbi:hypothetical protein [Dyella japonica]|uniref:Uncharacterized protein n=1 Tax=Dyella japonica DSM 16301 TaxID=1440762 RepID=A0A0G9H8P8_9GAMM|nr:hypothetical protein [Dyella japonica]KLD64092.1 hypothetical protein Y882_08390 [Dyella japonica DSM 16301]